MKQEITKQLIEILAAIVILVIILVIILSLIIGPAYAIRNAAIKSKEGQTQTTIKAFGLYTAQHDGHLWVLSRTSDYFLHHPDCPCNGKLEKIKNDQ